MDKNSAEAHLQIPNVSLSASASETSAGTKWNRQSWRDYLMTEVEVARCTFQCTAFCFMTGFIDAVSFSAIFVWCGFQTGNTVQLSLALARLFSPGNTDFEFQIVDRQALTSLITFILGASLGRIGDRIGAKTRAWLFLGTMIQCLFTMAAALTIWKCDQRNVALARGEPNWTNTLGFVGLGFMSASIGLQGIMGKRLNSQFATTVVLTTIWCELMADPKALLRKHVPSRDHKLISIFSLFIGGFISRALIDKIGSAWALGIGAFLRLLVAFSWIPAPAKEGAKASR